MWTRATREERTQMIASNPHLVFDIIEREFLQNREKYNGQFTSAISEFLTFDDAAAIFYKLTECTCCERHQTNRPTRMKYIYYPPHNTDQSEQLCTCSCRHSMRWICCTYQEVSDDNTQQHKP